MPRLRDLGAFLFIACAWGFSFGAVEIGLTSFPPLLLMAFRYDIAGVLLLGYAVMESEQWLPTTRADLIAISGGGLFWIALGNGVWFVGQSLTSSVLSGVMFSLIPIMTTVFSWLLLPDDRLTPLSVLGLLLSFLGALVLVWPTGDAIYGSGALGKGLLLAGVGGAALGSVLIRWAPSNLSSVSLAAWSVLVGAGVIHILSDQVGAPWSTDVTMSGVISLLYLSVIATMVVYTLYFALLNRYSAIEMTLVGYLVPPIAAVAGYLLFNEPITIRTISGFAVIIFGFCLMKRRSLRTYFTRLNVSSG